MFGRRKRDQQAVQAIREELALADRRARATLTDAITQIESRMAHDREEHARIRMTADTAIENVRASVTDTVTDVGRVLERVGDMCALVAEQMEADRVERRALAEALTRLVHQSALPAHGSDSETERVTGGTVFAVPDASSRAELSLVDHEADELRPARHDPEPFTIDYDNRPPTTR